VVTRAGRIVARIEPATGASGATVKALLGRHRLDSTWAVELLGMRHAVDLQDRQRPSEQWPSEPRHDRSDHGRAFQSAAQSAHRRRRRCRHRRDHGGGTARWRRTRRRRPPGGTRCVRTGSSRRHSGGGLRRRGRPCACQPSRAHATQRETARSSRPDHRGNCGGPRPCCRVGGRDGV